MTSPIPSRGTPTRELLAAMAWKFRGNDRLGGAFYPGARPADSPAMADVFAFADAILALFPVEAANGSGWRPIGTAPKGEPGLMIDVRSATTYRWLPYSGKSEQFRKGIKGRWQRATEYGWENAKLPTEYGEWIPNVPLAASPPLAEGQEPEA